MIFLFKIPKRGENGTTGTLSRIWFNYKDYDKEGKLKLIAKFSNENEEVKKYVHSFRLYEREVVIYKEMHKKFSIDLPKIFFSEIDMKSGDSLIIMEDLVEKNYKIGSIEEGTSLENLKSLLFSISKHHSQFWSYLPSQFCWLEESVFTNQIKERATKNFSVSKQKFLDYNKEILSSQLFKKLENYSIEKYYLNLPNLQRTLIHADLHLNNVFFNEKIERRDLIIDWQNVIFDICTRDIVHLVVTSLPSLFLKENFQVLKDFYFSSLQRFLSPTIFERETFEMYFLLSVEFQFYVVCVTSAYISTSKDMIYINRAKRTIERYLNLVEIVGLKNIFN